MNQRGSVLLVSMLFFPVLLGFVGLSIDVGNLLVQKAKLQNTADAAVLAGGQELPDTARAEVSARDFIKANGEEGSQLSVSFSGDNAQMDVSLTQTVPTYFIQLFKIPSVQISASAESKALVADQGPFKYAIFSGSKHKDLAIAGSNWQVNGSIYSNRNIRLNSSNVQVSDALEAVKDVKLSGTGNSYGSLKSHVSAIAMPDYSSLLMTAAANREQVFSGDKSFYGSEKFKKAYVKGKATVTGFLKSKGTLLADGDIDFTGTSGDGQVCFYSRGGNISVSCIGGTLNAVLYAPKGKITVYGAGATINGCIVGKEVSIIGTGITINAAPVQTMTGVSLVK